MLRLHINTINNLDIKTLGSSKIKNTHNKHSVYSEVSLG